MILSRRLVLASFIISCSFIAAAVCVTFPLNAHASSSTVTSMCPMTGPPGTDLCDKKGMCDYRIPCNLSIAGSQKGVCVTGKCLGTSFSGAQGGGPDQISSMIQSIMKGLLDKLMQGGGGGGGGAAAPPGLTTTPAPTCSLIASLDNASGTSATLSWNTQNASSVFVSPQPGSVGTAGSMSVVQVPGTSYVMTVTGAGGSGSCTTPPVGDSGLTGSSGCDLSSQVLGFCGSGNNTSQLARLSASARSGSVPLPVTFTVTEQTTTTCTRPLHAMNLEFGDGQGTTTVFAATDSCTPRSVRATYTYGVPGTYSAQLFDDQTETNLLTSLDVVVSGGSNTNSNNSTSGGTQVLVNTLNNSLQTGPYYNPFAPVVNGVPGTNGVIGNVILDQNGATIFASMRDQQNNSTVSGFYGGANGNGQASGLVGQLCASRPWAQGVVSYVISPAFFDGLCGWRGYTPTQPGTAPSSPPPKQTTAPGTSAQPSQQTQTPAGAVNAKATIWADPMSVRLGERTNVYWTTNDVSTCSITGPSFAEVKLSGGAATVPLSDDATFKINCQTATGQTVSDQVTVFIK